MATREREQPLRRRLQWFIARSRPLWPHLLPGVLQHRYAVRGAELHQWIEQGIVAEDEAVQLDRGEEVALLQQAQFELSQRLPGVPRMRRAIADQAVRVPAHQIRGVGVSRVRPL